MQKIKRVKNMNELKLIPYPKYAKVTEGILDCKVLQPVGGRCFAFDDFKEKIETYGVEFSANRGAVLRYSVKQCDVQDEEGYCITVDVNGINVSAPNQIGLGYAFCSLRQLIFNHDGKLPHCNIKDEPHIKHRGLLFDVGRYYFEKEYVFKIIDLCYLHKINVLHWHLTEDQGWRIQIDKYPLLTQKGSRRSHTNFGVKPHGGYYTKEDIKEIIAYANQRNIQVFPEIDMPGHIQSALACYPHLGCFDRKLKVATHWGVKHDPLCAGKESTYQFAFDVIDEVIEMFGENTKYIHIGGDEVFRHRWQLCKNCQDTMQKHGLKHEESLQGHFMKRLCEYIVDKGYIPVMWNGVDADIDVHPNAVWQFWSGEIDTSKENDAKRSLQPSKGFIVSNSSFTYLDFPYGMLDLKKAYSFDPIQKDYGDNMLGVEVSLWTEYVPNFKTACARLLPRLCALSEAMWSKEKTAYPQFEERLAFTVQFLKHEGFKSRPLRVANPNKLRGAAQNAWFGRRVLHWQGLHNLIDDAYVTNKLSKKQ